MAVDTFEPVASWSYMENGKSSQHQQRLKIETNMKVILFPSGGMASSQDIFEVLMAYLKRHPNVKHKYRRPMVEYYFFLWQINFPYFGHI